MLWNEALKSAEPILKQVVDCLAEKDYASLSQTVEFDEGLTADLLEEMVEGHLELNELPYIDKYGVACNFKPKYEYYQTSGGFYNDNSGFWVDYDLTTDSELNDLTLQMSFLFEGENNIKPILLDVHVL